MWKNHSLLSTTNVVREVISASALPVAAKRDMVVDFLPLFYVYHLLSPHIP